MAAKPGFIAKLRYLPPAILPTMMALASIGSSWNRAGFTLLFDVSLSIAIVVLLLYTLKIIFHWKVCVEEFGNAASACVCCAFTVLLMIITPWFAQWSFTFAQIVHYIAVVLHMGMVALFTAQHVCKGIAPDTFLPTWYVPYVGALISNVVAADLFLPFWPQVILVYGIAIYWVLLIPMIIRLRRLPIPQYALHSRAVMVAPASLCVIAYINVASAPSIYWVSFFYLVMLANLAYVAWNIPKFFAVPFSQSYAALTFPMAASTLASFRMSDFLLEAGYTRIGYAVTQLAGIQMYFTTAVIVFVVFNFVRAGLRTLYVKTLQMEES